jgi:phenylacetic acid degradation operon negative regulatory protein
MQGSTITEVTDGLRRRFLAGRPVRTASLIVTVFGDAIVPRGGLLSIRALVDLMGGLGIEAGAVRTAMSRLVADGLFVRRNGRRPHYALSAEAERTFAEAFRKVYAGERPEAGGGFRLIIAPAMAKKVLDGAAFAAAGYRAMAPGVLIAPASAAAVPLPAGAYALQAQADDPTVQRIAHDVLGLAETAGAYRRFVAEFSGPAGALAAGGAVTPAQAFALRMLAVHAFRRIVIRDPGLPEDLLPLDRPDRQAREIMATLYRAATVPAEAHLDAVTEADEEPLPALAMDLAHRFRSA